MLKDSRPGGWEDSGWRFYQNGVGSHVASDFQVLAYDLEMTLKDRLHMKAVLDVSETANTRYLFTLYHELNVKKVTTTEGIPLHWERDGDFLDIEVPDGTLTLVVEYSGECRKYYSNRQACLLPGYLIFYPVPGHQVLWSKNTSNRVPYQSDTISSFRLTVKGGPERLFTNLQQTGPRIYEGTAESLSVFGGLIQTEVIDGITCVRGIGDKKRFSFTYEELVQAWNIRRDSLELDEELVWDGTLLYQLPFTIRMSGGDLETAVGTFSQLYLCDLNSTVDMAAGRLIMTRLPSVTDEKRLAYDYLKHQMFEGGLHYWTGELEGPPAYEDLVIAKEKMPNWEVDYERFWKWFDAREILFDQLAEWRSLTLGREYVLARIYQYLLDEKDTTHSVDFVYNLK